MKRMLIVLSTVILLSSCTSTVDNSSNESAEKEKYMEESLPVNEVIPEEQDTIDYNNDLMTLGKKYEFISSFEGHQCSVAMLTFAKYYFNSDIERMKTYFLNEEVGEIDFSSNGDKDFSNIRYILIKGLVYDEETGVANAQLEYAWDDIYMNYYFDISMKKSNDKWKVVEVLLDA